MTLPCSPSVSTSLRRIASGTVTRLAVAAVAAVAAVTPGAVVAAPLVHVGQQRQLASALDRASDLHLVAPARPGDPPRAALALLGDELPQRRYVLVVDLLFLVAPVLARLAPAAAGGALLVSPANRLAATACFGHQRSPPRLRLRLGMATVENTKTSL